MKTPPIKFRHLNVFMEVARQKSVGRAADSLAISQPAVTKTIRELEQILEVRLFEKEGRGIRLSRLGEVFLHHAGHGIAAISEGVNALGSAARHQAPPIRIGALPTVSTRIMPKAMQLYLEEDLNNEIKIVTGENSVLLDQLRHGDLDLVVGRLAAPEKMTGLEFEHVYSERVVVVVREGHPLLSLSPFRLDRLQDFTVLMPTRASVIRPFVERMFLAYGMPELPRQIETVSSSFGRAFVTSSDAVWIISEGVVAGDLSEGRMRTLPIDTSETKGAVGMTTRRDIANTTGLSIMRQCIRIAAKGVHKSV